MEKKEKKEFQEVWDVLVRLELEIHYQKFVEEGNCKTVNDLTQLDEEKLTKIGFKKILARQIILKLKSINQVELKKQDLPTKSKPATIPVKKEPEKTPPEKKEEPKPVPKVPVKKGRLYAAVKKK